MNQNFRKPDANQSLMAGGATAPSSNSQPNDPSLASLSIDMDFKGPQIENLAAAPSTESGDEDSGGDLTSTSIDTTSITDSLLKAAPGTPVKPKAVPTDTRMQDLKRYVESKTGSHSFAQPTGKTGPYSAPPHTANAVVIKDLLGGQPGAEEKPLQPTIYPALPSADDKCQLGSGVIAGIIGNGGMGRVYKIWNESLEVYRAVKLLIPSHNKLLFDRFYTEAKITAKLHHPNIVEVHTTGDWNGLPYMEMELIEGVSLELLMARYGRLPAPVVYCVAYNVAKALAYAHQHEFTLYGKKYRGIIHRDLKPSNVMISKDGVVKLMDYGIARPVEQGIHTAVHDSLMGTMHYFSPEQMNGQPVDFSTDLYSLGIVLYEMLGGVRTFPQTTQVSLISMKMINQYEPLQQVCPSVSPLLAAVVDTCLQTERSKRYGSCDELVALLRENRDSFISGSSQQVLKNYLRNPEAALSVAGAKPALPQLKAQAPAPAPEPAAASPSVAAEVQPKPAAVKPRSRVALLCVVAVVIIACLAVVLWFLGGSSGFSGISEQHPQHWDMLGVKVYSYLFSTL